MVNRKKPVSGPTIERKNLGLVQRLAEYGDPSVHSVAMPPSIMSSAPTTKADSLAVR